MKRRRKNQSDVKASRAPVRQFEAVTTFSGAGFESYGRRMVETYCEFWPYDVRLATYSEGFNLPLSFMPRAENRKLPAWVDAFKDRHSPTRDRVANGWRTGTYDFRFDAFKFSNKTAAVIHAAEHSGADVLIWLDGDIVTHAPVDHDFLESMIGEQHVIAWLDRDRLYPETGFYALNLRHPMTQGLIATWRRLYETDDVFALRQWHDAFVLEHVVDATNAPWRSLSGGAQRTSHPLARGPLAERFDHLKGQRKSLTHSPEHRILA